MKKMGNLGNYLRERRIEKGISTEHIALHSSVNENILNALENEEYDYFHGYFYFINFLNEYLEFLKLNKDEVHSEFSDEITEIKKKWESNPPIPINGLRYSNFKNRRTLVKGIIIIVILIILYFLFGRSSATLSVLGKNKHFIPIPDKSTDKIPAAKVVSNSEIKFGLLYGHKNGKFNFKRPDS